MLECLRVFSTQQGLFGLALFLLAKGGRWRSVLRGFMLENPQVFFD